MFLLFIESSGKENTSPSFSVCDLIHNFHVAEINISDFLGLGKKVNFFYGTDLIFDAEKRYSLTCEVLSIKEV